MMSFDKEALGTAKHFSNSIEKYGDRYGGYRQFQEIRSLVITSHYQRDDLDSRPSFMCDVVTEFIYDVHDDGFIEIPEGHNISIVTYAVDMFTDWFGDNEKYDYVLDAYDIDEFIKFFLMNVSWRIDGLRGVKCLYVVHHNESETGAEMIDYNAGVEDEYHCFHCDKVTNEDDVTDNWFIIHGRTSQYVIGYSCPECWSVEHHNES